MTLDPSHGGATYCYLTTTGRVTGRPHTVEIWFVLSGVTVYMLNGASAEDAGRADWVRNLRRQPAVTLRILDHVLDAAARIVSDPAEDALARRLLLDKYQPTSSGDLTAWSRTALPVALDIRP